MLCLKSRTESVWLQRAIANTAEILVDHAHCERKAAANALNLLAKYPEQPQFIAPMLALAREEMDHFEQVIALLDARGIAVSRQSPSGYQFGLFKLLRKGLPDKIIDTLLVAALIEARSCERFVLLSQRHPDEELRALYRDLLESEARHYGVFVRLAHTLADPAAVRARLDELALAECTILENLAPIARIHA